VTQKSKQLKTEVVLVVAAASTLCLLIGVVYVILALNLEKVSVLTVISGLVLAIVGGFGLGAVMVYVLLQAKLSPKSSGLKGTGITADAVYRAVVTLFNDTELQEQVLKRLRAIMHEPDKTEGVAAK